MAIELKVPSLGESVTQAVVGAWLKREGEAVAVDEPVVEVRPGRRAVHNSGYWEGQPFLGLGPSAASGAGRWRAWNVRDWEAWRRCLDGGLAAVAGEEWLTDEQAAIEHHYLSLRTDAGLPLAAVPPETARIWVEMGWAGVDGDRLRLTAEGWLLLVALVAGLPVP